MNPIKRGIVLILGLATVFVLSLLIDSVRVAAQGGMSPSFHLAGPLPLPVLVTNPTEPFQVTTICNILAGQDSCEENAFEVPARKRAVIEYVSGDAGDIVRPYILATLNGVQGTHFVSPSAFFPGTVFGATVRLYADQGSTIEVGGLKPSAGDVTTLIVAISGHLIDVE